MINSAEVGIRADGLKSLADIIMTLSVLLIVICSFGFIYLIIQEIKGPGLYVGLITVILPAF